MRQHAKEITGRWARSACRFPQLKQSGLKLADMGKRHSSEAFFGCDEPVESVLFSAFLELKKIQEAERVDP